jgi:hypothetical protein
MHLGHVEGCCLRVVEWGLASKAQGQYSTGCSKVHMCGGVLVQHAAVLVMCSKRLAAS